MNTTTYSPDGCDAVPLSAAEMQTVIGGEDGDLKALWMDEE